MLSAVHCTFDKHTQTLILFPFISKPLPYYQVKLYVQDISIIFLLDNKTTLLIKCLHLC